MTRSGQANLGNRGDAAVRRTLTIFKDRGVKVIALQEAGDRRHVIEAWCLDNGWDAYFGDGSPGAASTPIIWAPDVGATYLATRPGTDATYTGRLGAGPNTVKAKVLNHGRFREPGEAPFVLINFHNPASLWLRRRRALAKQLMAEAGDMVERREDRVEVRVVGDANCRASSSVMRPLRKAGLTQRTRGRTKGLRTIDHVWARSGRGTPVVIPSDHRGVVFNPKENR